jgi:GAF domain-containing protein
VYARYQAAIADLTASVLADSELAALMCQAAALVTQTLAVAYGTIWELLPGGSVLELREASGWPVEAVAGMTATAAATSPIGAAVLGAAPVLVADWASETRFEQPELLREAGIISSLAVAIPGPGRAFGGLNVDVTASRIFSDEEVQFLRAVAHVLALAIQRSPAADTRSQPADERTQAIEQQLIAAAHERAVL